ncbi:MAG: M43 family zinc metalloprotease [Maribacter sp.]
MNNNETFELKSIMRKKLRIQILMSYMFILLLAINFVGCSSSGDPVIRDFAEEMEEETDSTEEGEPDTGDNPDSNSDSDPEVPSEPTPGFLRIAVTHHISRTDNGTNPAVDTDRITKIMGDINQNFEASGIEFFTKEIKFLDNSDWNQQFVKQDDFIENRVLREFEDDQALNIFYFFEIGNRRNGVITGTLGATALFPDEGNNLKLSASATAFENTATPTHELGHYLGLYHTDDDFRDANGNVELVNGSNCETAGDKICDTPASPDLNDSNIAEPSCDYVGTETDANGDRYNPDTLNFMTQWAGTDTNGNLCRRRFSDGQTAKMVSVLNNERAFLIE